MQSGAEQGTLCESMALCPESRAPEQASAPWAPQKRPGPERRQSSGHSLRLTLFCLCPRGIHLVSLREQKWAEQAPQPQGPRLTLQLLETAEVAS